MGASKRAGGFPNGPSAGPAREREQSMAEEPRGLTAAEVAERVARGDVNADVDVKTRSVRQIVRENVCTLFNAINVRSEERRVGKEC